MRQFHFVVEPPMYAEKRETVRRETDPGISVSKHPLKTGALCMAVALLLATGVWKWRYLVYGPAWLVRAHYADKSDLYKGSLNDRSNLELIQQARNYLSQAGSNETSVNFTVPEPLRNRGIRISPKWFQSHHPDAVDVNPFAPAAEGRYTVTWQYSPSCQQTIRSSPKSRTDWFDAQGQPCSPVCRVTVFMDRSLKLTQINITSLLP